MKPADRGTFFLVDDTERILAAFDDLTYRGFPALRLMNTQVWGTLRREDPGARTLRRRLLRYWPGRLFLRARARRIRRQLRDWGGAGVVLRNSVARGALDSTLPRLTTPTRHVFCQRDGHPRFSELVPGRSHPCWERAIATRHAALRVAEPELAARIDPGWLGDLANVARDSLDAADVFWAEVGGRGMVSTAHTWTEDMALGLEGRRTGRRVACVQHGFFYTARMWIPGAFDDYLTWDPWSSSRVRVASGGVTRGLALGHPGRLPPPFPRSPRARAAPRLLIATNPTSASFWEALRPALNDLTAADVPWEAVWKLHPGEVRAPDETLGPRSRRVDHGSIYSLMRDSDLLLGMESGTLAEARMLGLRVACLTLAPHPEFLAWATRHDVPVLTPDDDLRAAVEACLERPAPPPVPVRRGEAAAAAIARACDAILLGRPPASAATLRGP
jgi:hypothetical protein